MPARTPSPTPKKARIKPSTSAATALRATYHHGNLRGALIDATLRLAARQGAEKVTVRAAAKLAGVSSGAPFRHFPNRTALMTAVAEQASHRFRVEIVKALARVPADDPVARLRAIGDAYVRWVTRNPTHFQIISNRRLIDYDSSEALRRDNEHNYRLVEELLTEAQRRGLLRSGDVPHIALAARALSYGLGRMYTDGHFAQWQGPRQKPERAINAVFDLFIDMLVADKT